MTTPIVPVPDAVLAAPFPTNADRQAGEWNRKAKEWAGSENAMVERTAEIAVSAHTNATAAKEQAQAAGGYAGAASTSAGLAQGAADAAAGSALSAAQDAAKTAADRLAVEQAIVDGPVLSVNGKSGLVELGPADVGAPAASGGTATNITLTGSVTEAVHTLSGASPALNPANGTIQTWTLSAASAPTDSLAPGQAIVLHVDGAGFGVTWPSITWKTDGGNAPELASGVVVPVVLWKVGAVLYGARVGDA